MNVYGEDGDFRPPRPNTSQDDFKKWFEANFLDGNEIYTESRETMISAMDVYETISPKIQSLILAELKKVRQAGYDDMHQTYDYNRIVEALDERIKELSNG